MPEMPMKNQNAIADENNYVGSLNPEELQAYNTFHTMGHLVGVSVVEKSNNERLTEHNSQLEYEANHDELTGLLNERGFKKFLESKKMDGCILLFVDGTNVKRINDDFSHSSGDDAIIGIADVLKRSVRKNDRVARLHGDEFVVYIDPTQREEEEFSAEERFDRVKIGINDRTKIFVEKNKPIFEGFDIAVGGSIGHSDSTFDSLKDAAEEDMKVHKAEQHESLGAHRPSS